MPDFPKRAKKPARRLLRAVSRLLPPVLCLLGTAACTKREPPPAFAQILRVSQRNEPATLDPQLATLPDEFFIIRALSEGLVTPDPLGGAPQPAAAASWETSPDGLTWTFHLAATHWSNGEPVTAQDFVFMVHRAQDPATAAPKAALFAAVRAVAAPDPRTLVITLARPMPGFPALAASGPWIPVHRATVEKLGRDWTRPGNFVGNGRFVLLDWQPNQRISVRKNPRHHDASGTELAGIDFVAFDNAETEERAFRAGQVDVTMAVPVTKLATYRNADPAVLRTVPLYETRYLAVNTVRPPLDDARVRRALSLALDREALVAKVLKAGQKPAYNFVPRGLGGFQPAGRLAEDAAEARRLLAAAGFPDGKGFPKLELSTWSANVPVLEAVQQMWREHLGIEVALVQREARTHLASLAAGSFDLGFAPAIPDYDSAADLLERFTTENANNYPHWSDAEYDQFVAKSGPDLAKAETRLLEALPVIPLYFNTKNFLLRPAVRGWKEDPLWTRYYDHLSLAGH
jgi:oligopeptide transport system substrate-binding protein